MVIVAALIVAAAVIWAAQTAARARPRADAEPALDRAAQLLQMFAPGVAAAHADPRAVLTWQPLARIARQLFPDAFAALDRAAGAPFPFSPEQLDAAHARWTAEWLAWERSHDAEYRLKAAAIEHELSVSGQSPVVRARLDAVEREKLDQYQRHYEEYIRNAKALQALLPPK